MELVLLCSLIKCVHTCWRLRTDWRAHTALRCAERSVVKQRSRSCRTAGHGARCSEGTPHILYTYNIWYIYCNIITHVEASWLRAVWRFSGYGSSGIEHVDDDAAAAKRSDVVVFGKSAVPRARAPLVRIIVRMHVLYTYIWFSDHQTTSMCKCLLEIVRQLQSL